MLSNNIEPLKMHRFFSHHRFSLTRPNADVLVLQPHSTVRIFGLILCVIGCLLLPVGLAGMLSRETVSQLVSLLLLVFGVLLCIPGKLLLGPICLFDRFNHQLSISHFWRTRKIPLSRIASVQLLSAGEFESGNDSAESFQSYQLNLVLKSPEDRVFLAYNSDFADSKEKAKILSEFLEVPSYKS